MHFDIYVADFHTIFDPAVFLQLCFADGHRIACPGVYIQRLLMRSWPATAAHCSSFSSSILTRYLIWHLPFMCSLRQRQERVEKDQWRTKSGGKEPPIFSVDLLNCHDFMWLKWKRELGSVYSTINLSFKPKDLATLKL